MFRLTIIAALVTFPLLTGAARSDLVELKSGGQLRGRVVNQGTDQATYVIETAGGGHIAIDRLLVERIIGEDATDEAYQRRARAAKDTVEAHWQLAEWCREKSLIDESKQHLQRILEIEPEHVEARRLLGFRAVDGNWLTRNDLMESRGMVRHQGKYRTVQEIALLERSARKDAILSQWRNRLRRNYRNLTDRDADERNEARRAFEAIRDPGAVEAIVDLLSNEEQYEVKLLLLDVLSRIHHPLSFDTLALYALNDPNEEIRAQSLDYLIDSDYLDLATPFVRALESPDNWSVNRAAYILREIGDPRTISPLIDALVTEHKITIGGNPSGGDQYAFSPTSGGFSFGGSRPRVVKRRLKNPQVLSALVALSGGQSFDYDQAAWQTWLAAQAKAQRIDMRRDP